MHATIPGPRLKARVATTISGPRLRTRAEAAEYLGFSTQTLAHWATTGRVKLPYIRIGGRARYRQEDLDAFIEAGRGTTAGEITQRLAE